MDHRRPVQHMQPHGAALHPGLVRRKGQQPPPVDLYDLLLQRQPLVGVLLQPRLHHQVLHGEDIHLTGQIGVPLVAAPAGEDAVLQHRQVLLENHRAEPVQDGPQRHVGVGAALAAPQGVGQRGVGDPLPPLQHQVLHQRRRLAGLGQRRQHRLPVHADLKATQHPDLHFCHLSRSHLPARPEGPPTAHPFFVWFSVWVKYTKGWAACPAKKAFFRSFIWEPFAFLYKAQGYCTAYWSADCRPAASSLVSQEGTGAPMAVAFSAMEPSSVKIYHTSVTGSTSTV